MDDIRHNMHDSRDVIIIKRNGVFHVLERDKRVGTKQGNCTMEAVSVQHQIISVNMG